MNDAQIHIIVAGVSCSAGVILATLGYRGLFMKEWPEAAASAFDRVFMIIMFAAILAYHF